MLLDTQKDKEEKENTLSGVSQQNQMQWWYLYACQKSIALLDSKKQTTRPEKNYNLQCCLKFEREINLIIYM